MLGVRKRALPAGWYPGSSASVQARLREFELSGPQSVSGAVAGVLPHAGWDFSGASAASVVRSLAADTQTVVVVGGHLGPRSPILAAAEDGFEVPGAVIPSDGALLDEIGSILSFEADRQLTDNSVEVQLPLIGHIFPDAKVLWFRSPPSSLAEDLGEAIYVAARTLARKVAVLGSTDLTHYGPSYGFTPVGSGEGAVRWVRDTNDRAFIDAVLSLDGPRAVAHALKNSSACSSGAAATAIAFARRAGCGDGLLLDHRSSLSVLPDAASFVGYAAIVFCSA